VKVDRYFAALLGSLMVALVLVLSIVLLPVVSAGAPRLQGALTPTVFVYLPYVAHQYPPPTPTPTSTPQPTGPLPPVQIAPANGVILDTICPSFSIDNSAIGQPARAELQYAPVPDFTSDVGGFLIGFFQGTVTVPLFWNLNEGTTYYWRLRSSFDGTDWGEWSGVWSFTTASGGALPGAPTLISPADQSTVGSLRPTLTCSPVTGATRHAIAVGGSVYFSTSNELTLSRDLDPDTTYKWSVSARNSYGWGTKSSEWTFITPSIQSMPNESDTGATGLFFDLQGAMMILNTGH
jgi:hypothetical protein